MNRLPDRPDSGSGVKKTTAKQDSKKKGLKENLGMYGALFIIVAVVFVITQKVQVPFDEMTIKDYTPKEDNSGFFVVGQLADGEKFAGSRVELDEENGVAEIVVYKYNLASVFGTQDFVVMIDTPESEVKEIWLSCTDNDTQKTERTQLDFRNTEEAES